MHVTVVTDSTAYLPAGFAQRHRVRVVPLHVAVDGRSALDGVDLGPAELAEVLSQRRVVTTSRPSPAEFIAVYRELLDAGAEAVVSVHLSRKLSGTWEAARLAAREVDPTRIAVIDSRSTAMGLGFAVLAAATAASNGTDPAGVERAAVEAAARTKTFFCVDTLDHLRRGGRIGAGAAMLGTALAVKSLLHVEDGTIVPLEKVRTMSRAITHLIQHAVAAAGEGPAGVAVQHLAAPHRAAELAATLDKRLPDSGGCLVSELGAVIGAHTGPGVLGVVVLPGGANRMN
jgi:DegV family protein with EDD domain